MGDRHSEYDKLLQTMRDSGPDISHNFYKCFAKKQQRAEEYLKEKKRTPQNLTDSV